MKSSTTNIITAITRQEHDALVGILGRPLTQDPMRCPAGNYDAAPDTHGTTDLEQLMDRRRAR